MPRAAGTRLLTEPRFVGSFPRADVALDPPLAEVAFVGRSNVGKSSLLNAIVGARIAKTSGTPGKTRMLNVYAISGQSHVGARHAVPLQFGPMYLLDLPGYGYARAGKADRAAFRRLVHHALRRERLAGVVWLVDLRREPSPDDRAMQDLLAEGGCPVLAALTKADKLPQSKADKLPQSQRRSRERDLRAILGVPEDQVVVTSARTGEGMAELREAIAGLIQNVGDR